MMNSTKRTRPPPDDDEETAYVYYLMCMAAFEGKKRRKVKWKYNRLDWNEHVQMCRHNGEFQRRYHMSLDSFNKLVDLLRPAVEPDKRQATNSTSGNGPITAELVVAAGLKYLGGTPAIDVAQIIGCSSRSSVRIINKFLDAVVDCKDLDVSIPSSEKEYKEKAEEWHKISKASGVYYGVIGAIDGWLCCIEKPADVPSPVDYFSGHYFQYGINVQAVCDANLRFLYFGVVAPGKTFDARVFVRCNELQRWLDTLPEEYYIVGDNAYPLSNKLLIPFSGKQVNQRDYNRDYNYFLSEHRIRIEMAFGRLTSKFRIFRRNLDCSMETNSKIIQAACRLHNYVITNDKLDFSNATELQDFEVDRLEIEEENNGYLRGLVVESVLPTRTADDERREELVTEIKAKDLRRPDYNIERNG